MFGRIIALILAILLIPIFIILSLIIFLNDGFPILFIQKRSGKNNIMFNLYKFRTMKKETPDIATHLMKKKNNYILKSGYFLRKTSLDELPQIFNIIKGDITFIGPRPALHNQEDLIALRNNYNISSLKPGITGWAQVNGRDSLSIEEKVKYDYEYLKNKNFRLDCLIIYRTIIKVLLAKDIS
tara:strand:- start:523 stop:1071 length:549 start_codon:yes stop_codon:yes gene_type:complete